MKAITKTSRILKRVLGILVPSLALLVSVIMVSVSFAWFAQDVNPTVQTVRLTTAKAFTISFVMSEDSSGTRNINYKGQTAIDKNGRLVTDFNGREYDRPDKVELNQYLLDMPYYFITVISLDTEDTEVKMSMQLDIAKITSSGGSILNSYDSGNGSYDPEDLPYAFTWYFTEHIDGVQNYREVGEDVYMKNDLPGAGDIWYTPYGRLTFGEDGLIAQVNGSAVSNSSDGTGTYSLLDEGLKEMLFSAKQAEFDFHIVFAPEKLFWSQFCVADRRKTVGDIYSDEQLIKIFGSSSRNQMYYSNMAYFGSKFEFGATLRVSEIDGNPVQ